MTIVVFDFGASEVRAWDLETQTLLLCEAACLGVRQGSFIYGNECKKDLDSAREGTRGVLLHWRRKGLSTLLSPALDLCHTYQEGLLVFCDWLREQVIHKARMTRAVVLINYAGQESTDHEVHASVFRSGLQCPVVVKDHVSVMAAAFTGHAAGFCSIGQSHCVLNFGEAMPFFAGWDEIDIILRRHVFGAYAEDGTNSVSLDLQLVKARDALTMEGVNEVPLKSISDSLPKIVLSRRTIDDLLSEKIRALTRAVKQSRSVARANFIVTGRGRGAWWLLQALQTKFTILRHLDTEKLVLTHLRKEMACEVLASPRPITPAEIVRRVKGSQQECVELSQQINALETKLIAAVKKYKGDTTVADLQRRFDQMNMRLDGVTAEEWADLERQVVACLERDPQQAALQDQLAPLQQRVAELEAELVAQEAAAQESAVRAHDESEKRSLRELALRREVAQTKEALREAEAEITRLREIDARRVAQLTEERARMANEHAATTAATKSHATTQYRQAQEAARATEQALRAEIALLTESNQKLTAERDHERTTTVAARRELAKITQDKESECEQLQQELSLREKGLNELSTALKNERARNAELEQLLERLQSATPPRTSAARSMETSPPPAPSTARAAPAAVKVLPNYQGQAKAVDRAVQSLPSADGAAAKRLGTRQSARQQSSNAAPAKSQAVRKVKGAQQKESINRLSTPKASVRPGWNKSTK